MTYGEIADLMKAIDDFRTNIADSSTLVDVLKDLRTDLDRVSANNREDHEFISDLTRGISRIESQLAAIEQSVAGLNEEVSVLAEAASQPPWRRWWRRV